VTRRSAVVRWNGNGPSEVADELAIEEPLEIRIGDQPVSVTMRTPGHDVELVVGMLLSERMIAATDRPLVRHQEANVVNVALSVRTDTIMRSSVTSTSCGLCGKMSIAAVHQHFPPVEDDVRISRTLFPAMLDALTASQQTFARTGGLHAAAVFNRNGELLVAREDVGRHNAVDKAIGYALLRGLVPLRGCTLLVSGRASFEIVQKALGAGIPVIAAVSAPSSLAVELADESEQTLVGFVRGDRCNVYTHTDRILP
jgi:FdhD protein